jgi:hypothetical protein
VTPVMDLAIVSALTDEVARLTAERDAALERVAELEEWERRRIAAVGRRRAAFLRAGAR